MGKGLPEQIADLHARASALGTGAHPTKVIRSGNSAGRNKAWKRVRLANTSGGSTLWMCVRGDVVYLRTVGEGFIIADPPATKPQVLFQVSAAAKPAYTQEFYGLFAKRWFKTLIVTPQGRVLIYPKKNFVGLNNNNPISFADHPMILSGGAWVLG